MAQMHIYTEPKLDRNSLRARILYDKCVYGSLCWVNCSTNPAKKLMEQTEYVFFSIYLRGLSTKYVDFPYNSRSGIFQYFKIKFR